MGHFDTRAREHTHQFAKVYAQQIMDDQVLDPISDLAHNILFDTSCSHHHDTALAIRVWPSLDSEGLTVANSNLNEAAPQASRL
jgi:hypothetical protein